MDTWEYFTTTLTADIDRTPVPTTDDIPLGRHPRYSVHTLMPQLTELGAKGWELVSLQPVQVGSNGDVRVCDASSGHWTYTYLAAFKRPTNLA